MLVIDGVKLVHEGSDEGLSFPGSELGSNRLSLLGDLSHEGGIGRKAANNRLHALHGRVVGGDGAATALQLTETTLGYGETEGQVVCSETLPESK